MRNKWSYFHKYRKYRKRLSRRWNNDLALLKYNYFFKLYGEIYDEKEGGHIKFHLWDLE